MDLCLDGGAVHVSAAGERVQVLVNCNDWFVRGRADAVEIEPEDVDVIEACWKELSESAGHVAANSCTLLLFATRKAGETPDRAALDRLAGRGRRSLDDVSKIRDIFARD